MVSGSFAFSIILFLSFSATIDFMNHAITPLRPSAPDFYVGSGDTSNSLPPELAEQIGEFLYVKRVFGRSSMTFALPAGGEEMILTVISYDEQQFKWAKDDLLEGSFKDALDGKGMLLAFREDGILPAGSSIAVPCGENSREVPVAGILGSVPFSYGTDKSTGSREGIAICSESLFRDLFGDVGYAVIDIQFQSGVTDAQVQELRRMIEERCAEGDCEGGIVFSDRRIENRESKGASYSLGIFLYGFLTVIALIAFFNILNCIAMSVSARMREYGAMRAVGMTVRQIVRMVWGETITYTFFGVLFGCLAGLPLNRLLFRTLVTERWGDAWELPGKEFLVILIVITCSVVLAVRGPARRIREMTVVDTIGAD